MGASYAIRAQSGSLFSGGLAVKPEERRGVHDEMSALLADRYVCTAVDLDRQAWHCHVTFTRVRT